MNLDPAEAALLPGTSFLGSVLVNAYIKEILGKKTYGRVLNIGAGSQSTAYRYDLRLSNTEYHTLETSAESNPTFVGDVRNMPEVPSESYDWVLALAVLEHVSDIHAAVREITRVVKPGGHIYLSVPFHNELHFSRSYGDYWRVSPFGFHELLDANFAFEEVEYWGDCVIDPIAVGIVARKGQPPAQGVSRLYYIDGGLDSAHRLVRGDFPFRWTMPIWRLNVDGLEYCLEVQEHRASLFSRTGHSLSLRAADKQMFHRVAVSEGTIVISNEGSRMIPHGDDALATDANEKPVATFSLDLQTAIRHNTASIDGRDPAIISTPPEQWAYAAEYVIPREIITRPFARLKIQVTARLVQGAVGIGCLADDGNYLREAHLTTPGAIEQVTLAVHEGESCRSVVIRNIATSSRPSVIELTGITVFELDADAAVKPPPPRIDETDLRAFLARSPGGPGVH